MAKVAEQRLARALRQQGWSIKAISKYLSVSPGSVSRWVRDIKLDFERLAEARVAASLLWREKTRQTRLAKERERKERERQEARRLYEKFKNEPLFIAGLVGYWAERSKTSHHLRVANTDPNFLYLMLNWFRRYGGVSEGDISLKSLKVYMHAELGVAPLLEAQSWL